MQIKKNTIIAVSLIFSVFIIAAFIILVPLFLPKNFVDDKELNQNLEYKTFSLMEFNLLNPKFAIITSFNVSNLDSKNDGYERGLEITVLKRKNLIFWEKDRNVVQGKFSDTYSVNDMIQITKQFDLVNNNKDPNNIVLTLPNGQVQSNKSAIYEYLSPEDEYFERISKQNEHSTNLDDFKFLKKDMEWKSIYRTVGGSDRGMRGYYSKKEEIHYFFGKDSINFIALVFDQAPGFVDDNIPKLQSVSIVKSDRTIIEVPVKPDGYFDFEAVKQQLE